MLRLIVKKIGMIDYVNSKGKWLHKCEVVTLSCTMRNVTGHKNLPHTDPCCHGNQLIVFEQKNGYNY